MHAHVACSAGSGVGDGSHLLRSEHDVEPIVGDLHARSLYKDGIWVAWQLKIRAGHIGFEVCSHGLGGDRVCAQAPVSRKHGLQACISGCSESSLYLQLRRSGIAILLLGMRPTYRDSSHRTMNESHWPLQSRC